MPLGRYAHLARRLAASARKAASPRSDAVAAALVEFDRGLAASRAGLDLARRIDPRTRVITSFIDDLGVILLRQTDGRGLLFRRLRCSFVSSSLGLH